MTINFDQLIYAGIAVGATVGVYLLNRLFVLPLLLRYAKPPVGSVGALIFAPRLIGRLHVVVLLAVLLLVIPSLHELSLLNQVWPVRLLQAFLTLSGGWVAAHLLDIAGVLYERLNVGKQHGIQGYVQLAKIVLYAFVVLLCVAILASQPVGYYIGGLGAALAVILLVFRDTILSFVATLQIQGENRIQIGDWIEAPEYSIDGEVTEISLHTVKVQNWDKTIATVPTSRIVATTLRNWRGMEQSGGRRIKRAIRIDMSSIRFLNQADIKRLSQLPLLQTYVKTKIADLDTHQKKHGTKGFVRRLTNIGTYRAYIRAYLSAHPGLETDKFTCIVRQRRPDSQGIPLEIYTFTATTEWVAYEGIQADIFDHLLAIMREFDLRPYQDGLLEGLSRQGIPLYTPPQEGGSTHK